MLALLLLLGLALGPDHERVALDGDVHVFGCIPGSDARTTKSFSFSAMSSGRREGPPPSPVMPPGRTKLSCNSELIASRQADHLPGMDPTVRSPSSFSSVPWPTVLYRR